MSDEDRRAYPSLAAAHCDVTNAIFAWVRARSSGARFLFCPTPYCDQMDCQQLGGTGYLDEVGRLLSPEIDVFWTGPEIISAEIPVESIERLTRRIGRPPVLWDNLFANDYDFHRLHCGPYSGRSLELRDAVRGILVNPNNEYPINFIPLSTLAAFLNSMGEWKPREAFLVAAAEWLKSFETVSQPIPLEDLVLLADCFYLPYSEGPEGAKLIEVVEKLFRSEASSAGEDYEAFARLDQRIQILFSRLTKLRDRELFHAWSRHGWSLKEGMQVVSALLKRRGIGTEAATDSTFEVGFGGVQRVGLLSRMEQLMDVKADPGISI